MGPGSGATENDLKAAFKIGEIVAEKGFYVLTGGRASGVMEAAMKGSKSGGGTTIGILPSEDGKDLSDFVEIPIKTGMGSARNNINVLTADIIIGIGIGPGTASEIALAIKAEKKVLLINQRDDAIGFFKSFGHNKLFILQNTEEITDHLDT